ncbi:PAS domain-containing protein [Palleronia sediminis]|uniref:PAS domain-containing protein n=1 Tax=Palleronia sediminis TaxID=2547833 RepID=A0A4R6AHF6_9RHOB|nr:PAS domain-containing protein [Palleronia sediminis]TDL83631.1 PAS domain-containing protein [Palleronia sediminis]
MVSDKVVFLGSHKTAGQTDPLAALDAWWRGLCKGRIMPLRDEVDPAALSRNLDRVCLIERIAPRQARFRLAGQNLAAILGMDLRGMPVSCLFEPSARAALGDALAVLFDEPARTELRLSEPPSAFRTPVTARLLLLPLRGRSGEPDRAIGLLDPGAATVTQRLRIEGADHRTLIGCATRPDPVDAPFAAVEKARSIAARRAGFRVVD